MEYGPTGESYGDYDEYGREIKKIVNLDTTDIYRITSGCYFEINKYNIHQLQDYKQVGILEDSNNLIYGYVILKGTDLRVIRYPLVKYLDILKSLN